MVQFCWAHVNCSFSFLFLANRSGTRCGPLLLQSICFKVRRVARSRMLFCITCYCCLRISLKQSGRSSLTFDVNEEFSQRELPLARYFLFFRPFSVIPRGGCEGKNPSMSAVSELLRPACLAPTTMPHSESLNFPFVPILMLSFHFSTVLLPLSALLGWLDFCINNEVNRCT